MKRIFFGAWKDEPLEWIVIKEDAEKYLMHLAYGIGVMPYDREGHWVSWETSAPRQWLYETFLPRAFTRQETEYLLPVTIDNYRDLRETAPTRYQTAETVFLLSESEIRSLDLEPSAWKRRLDGRVNGKSYGTWWLRSFGMLDGLSMGIVRPDGVIYPSGDIRADDVMICPVVCVDRNSLER